VVSLRDAQVAAVDDRVIDGAALRLLDVLHPRRVILDRIAAQADDLRVALVELGLELRHVAELGRANRGEILRMREEDRPAIPDPLVEVDAALCRVRREIRRDVSDMQSHRFLLSRAYSYAYFSNG